MHTMKTKPQMIVLAVSCFLAGIFTHYLLTPQRQPTPLATTSSLPSVAMPRPPNIYHLPENALRRPAPDLPEKTAPHLRGYFDWIQPADLPAVDLRDLK
jgi:hypothetical protein